RVRADAAAGAPYAGVVAAAVAREPDRRLCPDSRLPAAAAGGTERVGDLYGFEGGARAEGVLGRICDRETCGGKPGAAVSSGIGEYQCDPGEYLEPWALRHGATPCGLSHGGPIHLAAPRSVDGALSVFDGG